MNEPAQRAANEFLDGMFADLTADRMKRLGLAALRLYCKDATGPREVRYAGWRQRVIQDLMQADGHERPDGLDMQFLLDATISRPRTGAAVHHMRMAEFWGWMVRGGFAVYYPPDGQDHHTRLEKGGAWIITRTGLRLVNEDHPCRPGAMDRLREEFAGELPDSIARLEDARECFELGLMRPTIILLGLAYEDMAARVCARLGVKVKGKQPKAADVLEALRKHVDSRPNDEAKRRAQLAFPVANQIREHRNDGAHKAEADFDSMAVDSLLTVGLRFYRDLAGLKAP